MMKHLFLSSVLICCMLLSYAQNHVPNCSFEQYNLCPNNFGEIDRATGWKEYHAGSSDYYNGCSGGLAKQPTNNFGYQAPIHGNGYVGLYTYEETSASINVNFKEHFTRQIQPLIPGNHYEVSMYVSLSEKSSYATNDLCIWLYDSGPNVPLATYNITTPPTVSFSSIGPVTDMTNWIRLSAIFLADSAYDNIVVGGSDLYSNLSLTTVTPVGFNGTKFCYYYIDSVTVSKVQKFRIDNPDTILCAGDSLLVPYTVLSTGYFTGGNTFTIQLSDDKGGFSHPLDLGTLQSVNSGMFRIKIPANIPPGYGYVLRLVSTNRSDTSLPGKKIHINNVHPEITATITSPVCEGDSVIFDMTGNIPGTTFSWQGPNSLTGSGSSVVFQNIPASNAGRYIAIGVILGCKGYDTAQLVVNTYPYGRTVKTNSPLCVGDTLKLQASGFPVSNNFIWTGPSGFISNMPVHHVYHVSEAHNGLYIITQDNHGCKTNDTIEINVNQKPLPAIITTNAPLCEPAELKFKIDNTLPGLAYIWSGPNGFSSSQADAMRSNTMTHDGGYYYLITRTQQGCSIKDSVKVDILPIPKDVFITTNTPVCLDSPVILNAISSMVNVVYKWLTPKGTEHNSADVTITGSDTQMKGKYLLRATLGMCSIELPVEVDVFDPRFELNNPDVQCDGDILTLNLGIPYTTYLWQDGSTANQFNIQYAGTYWVTATNKCGIFADTVTATYEDCDCDIFIPSVFSPNNDGLNDAVCPIIDCVTTMYSFIIVNRWGQRVFVSSTPGERWNGSYNNEPAKQDNYFYLLQLTGGIRKRDYARKGEIMLVR